MLDTITTLKDQWFDLYPQYLRLHNELLDSVVRWEWANGPRYDPRPYYFQRGTTKGRLLRRKSITDRDDMVWKCGYNNEGKCVVSRSNNGTWESLSTFHDDYVELARYQTYYKILRGVSRLNFQNGQPSYFLSFILQGDPEKFGPNASQVWQLALDGLLNIAIEREDYIYSGEQLIEIKITRWDSGFEYEKRESRWEGEYHLEYRNNGALDRIIYKVPAIDFTRTTYRKRKSGETLKSLTNRAYSALIADIPQLVAAQNFTDPLYCLRLNYFETTFFPPTVLPGFESERQRIVDPSENLYSPHYVWSVWDFENDEDEPYPPYPFENTDTIRACEILQIEIDMGSRFGHARRLLYQIARKLNQLDWSAYTPITSNFIVFAHDDEDIASALRYSGATREQIRDWRQRGLLE